MNDYERTVQAIQDLDKVPSALEWNKIASEYGYLTTYTLRMITNMNFLSFCKLVRRKNLKT